MNKRITTLILISALMVPAIHAFADDANVTGNNNDPLRHPINAYTNHEVKEDIKSNTENSQKAAESKATYKQAKADYEKSLKDSGANSAVTVAAKKRMTDARADMRKYNKKVAKANTDLKADETKAQQ